MSPAAGLNFKCRIFPPGGYFDADDRPLLADEPPLLLDDPEELPLFDLEADERELPLDEPVDEPDFDEDDRELLPDADLPELGLLVPLPVDLELPPVDLDPPADLELPLPADRDPADGREAPPVDLEAPDEELLPPEADLLAGLLLADDLPDLPDPFALFAADLEAPLFEDDDPLFEEEEVEPLFEATDFFAPEDEDFFAPDDEEVDPLFDDEEDEPLLEAADFFAPEDDRDEPVEPPRFVPLCELTPPVMSAAVDAAPITAPFAAPVASSVTTFAASSSTLVTALLPEDFREPDVLLLVFAAILLVSFFLQAHHTPCVYTQRAVL